MKVTVDRDTCQTHGQCVFAAPGVFRLDGDDTLHYLADVPDGEAEPVQDAAAACPVGAISVSP